LFQNQARQVYIWILTDFKGELTQIHIPKSFDIEIDLSIINSDGSHFPSTEKGFFLPYSLLTAFLSLFLFIKIPMFYRNNKKDEKLDIAQIMLITALVSYELALINSLVYQYLFFYNGYGLPSLLCLAPVLEFISSFIVYLFLLLLAFGWTINFMEIPKYQVFIPIAAFFLLAHIIILAISSFIEANTIKYHPYDDLSGYFIGGFRIVIFAIFISAIRFVNRQARQKIKKFI